MFFFPGAGSIKSNTATPCPIPSRCIGDGASQEPSQLTSPFRHKTPTAVLFNTVPEEVTAVLNKKPWIESRWHWHPQGCLVYRGPNQPPLGVPRCHTPIESQVNYRDSNFRRLAKPSRAGAPQPRRTHRKRPCRSSSGGWPGAPPVSAVIDLSTWSYWGSFISTGPGSHVPA